MNLVNLQEQVYNKFRQVYTVLRGTGVVRLPVKASSPGVTTGGGCEAPVPRGVSSDESGVNADYREIIGGLSQV